MVTWIVVATLFSILVAFSLPRKSVRVRYAALSSKGRLQFFLFAGGVWVLAVLFWFEVWTELQGRGHGEFLIQAVIGTISWGVALSATEIPDIWRGRSPYLKDPPESELYGRRFGFALLSATPTLLVAIALLPLSLEAEVLASHGIIDQRWFWWLVLAFFAGLVVAFVPLMGFNRPRFLVPPPLRSRQGMIPGTFRTLRKVGRRSHRTR